MKDNQFQILLEWFEDPGQSNIILDKKVLRNPPIKALYRLFDRVKNESKNPFRFIIIPNMHNTKFSTIHFWNAYDLTHEDVFEFFRYDIGIAGSGALISENLLSLDPGSGVYYKNKYDLDKKDEWRIKLKDFPFGDVLSQFPVDEVKDFVEGINI